MRRLRYSVAVSVDGFIADEGDGYEWIVSDPAIDFGELLAGFDALVMGRRSYEVVAGGGPPGLQGLERYVVSTTLDPSEHPEVTIVSRDVPGFVSGLKRREGKDIWLFGGGVLFRSLLEADLVDEVEVGLIPALLGQGIPVLPGLAGVPRTLRLEHWRAYPSGVLLLRYAVEPGPGHRGEPGRD